MGADADLTGTTSVSDDSAGCGAAVPVDDGGVGTDGGANDGFTWCAGWCKCTWCGNRWCVINGPAG